MSSLCVVKTSGDVRPSSVTRLGENPQHKALPWWQCSFPTSSPLQKSPSEHVDVASATLLRVCCLSWQRGLLEERHRGPFLLWCLTPSLPWRAWSCCPGLAAHRTAAAIHSVVSDSAAPWTVVYQAPLWDFPGKSTGAGYHFLLQGIFPNQRSNLCLLGFLPWQADFLPLEPPGKL